MKTNADSAVSPVVGVMLMLVVTIIIAAVVTGFSGGLVGGNNQKAPQLTMDVKIENNGYVDGSYFAATVTGVSSSINTHNLEMVTTWTKTFSNGTQINGGGNATPGVMNTFLDWQPNGWIASDYWNWTSPQGFGPGVGAYWYFWPVGKVLAYPQGSGSGSKGSFTVADMMAGKVSNASWWGNYNLMVGTTMYARPFGSAGNPDQAGDPGTLLNWGYGCGGVGPYVYSYGSGMGVGGSSGQVNFIQGVEVDAMQGLLGTNWNILRNGDIVHVKVIDVPIGKTIWQNDVVVGGQNYVGMSGSN